MNATTGLIAGMAISLFTTQPVFAQAESMRWPVSDSITGINFGMDNDAVSGSATDYKCGTRSYDGHRGTDIGAPKNSTVFASATGWVQERVDGFGDGYLGNQDGYGFGNHVALFHSPNYNSIYGHLTAGSGIPNKDETILCGVKIGTSGNSGNSSGPHLHFEIRLNVTESFYYSGKEVDPFSGACSTPVSYWTKLDSAGVPTTACKSQVVGTIESSYSEASGPNRIANNFGHAKLELVVPAIGGEDNQMVSLEIYDFAGKFLARPLHTRMPIGSHSRVIEATHLAPGLYYGRLSIGHASRETLTWIKAH